MKKEIVKQHNRYSINMIIDEIQKFHYEQAIFLAEKYVENLFSIPFSSITNIKAYNLPKSSLVEDNSISAFKYKP